MVHFPRLDNYRPRSKGDNTFGSICPSVYPSIRQRSHGYVHAAEWSIYGLGVLCVFVSNQGTFAIKELRAAVGGF